MFECFLVVKPDGLKTGLRVLLHLRRYSGVVNGGFNPFQEVLGP